MTERPTHGSDHILRGLSLPRRIGQVLAGLGGLTVAVTITLLWATEPGELPLRTRIAFAAIIGVGTTWAGFAGWVIARRPLFAIDRLIAGWLAVAFSVLTTLGLPTVAVMRGSGAAAGASAGLGVVLTAAAGVTLVRARAYRRTLLARRDRLQRPGD